VVCSKPVIQLHNLKRLSFMKGV